MAKARCPRCGGLFGPPLTILFHHLRDDEHEYIEWYEANTGTLKLKGWLPGTVEFVKEEA